MLNRISISKSNGTVHYTLTNKDGVIYSWGAVPYEEWLVHIESVRESLESPVKKKILYILTVLALESDLDQ